MLFNSIQFGIFFLFVTALYFVLPHKIRWLLLLVSSIYFYMAFIPIYVLILIFTIIIDYFAGIYLEKLVGANRKWFLILSLIANIGVLAVFKYYNFIDSNLNFLFHSFGVSVQIPALNIILPIGLSFHTFQAMSYTIEVYRGHQKAEHNFGIYALYVMFYPQLVAGPIERPQNLLHQFYEKHFFEYKRVVDGLKLMAWGLFKKVVIADRLALIVNQVYNSPHDYVGFQLLIATIFFAFQIYCDFSGYSDIAIGAARVMGFKLMKNFDSPYYSKSISEFWKRWHISLSSWFKDYLYISLGGNRVSIPRWYFNLFFVFMVSGLWHGANWTFVIWGALHGFYLIFSIVTSKPRKIILRKLYIDKFPLLLKILEIISVFVFVDFAWIFFRAQNLSDAFYIVNHLFDKMDQINNLQSIVSLLKVLNITMYDFIVALTSIVILEIIQFSQRKISIINYISSKPIWFRWTAYYALIIVIILLGVFNKSQFIYFQF